MEEKSFDELDNAHKVDFLLEIFEDVALEHPGDLNVGKSFDMIYEYVKPELPLKKFNEFALLLILGGYVEPLYKGMNVYRISPKGAELLIAGGYRAKYERELIEDEIQLTQMKLNLQLLKHNKFTLFAIYLGVFFSLVTLVVSFLDYLK